MSQSIHLDAMVWNEDEGNEAVLLPFQPLHGGSRNDLINAILQLKSFPHLQPMNLHLEEVCFTRFPQEYLLLTFMKGHTDPLNT